MKKFTRLTKKKKITPPILSSQYLNTSINTIPCSNLTPSHIQLNTVRHTLSKQNTSNQIGTFTPKARKKSGFKSGRAIAQNGIRTVDKKITQVDENQKYFLEALDKISIPYGKTENNSIAKDQVEEDKSLQKRALSSNRPL